MDAEVQWYYMQGGGSQGPVALQRLLELLESGVIDRTTPIMRADGTDWHSLDQALEMAGHAPPALPGSAAIVPPKGPALNAATARSIGGPDGEPHPWRRYFARMVDVVINGLAMWVLIGLVLGAVDQDAAKAFSLQFSGSQNRVAAEMLTLVLVMFPNALMIGFTGATVGKWLFGIRVTREGGQPIGLADALWREVLVWFRGLGIGFPIVTLITLIKAYRTLKNDGSTTWDRDMSLRVHAMPSTLFTILGGVALFAIVCAVAVLTNG
ncbi:MAG: RDD family protein [Rhizomicrobium sp.]